MASKMKENYKLIDLLKFIFAFLMIEIHTNPLQETSNLCVKIFYYDISNYAVPFFYACTDYFLIIKIRINHYMKKHFLI